MEVRCVRWSQTVNVRVLIGQLSRIPAGPGRYPVAPIATRGILPLHDRGLRSPSSSLIQYLLSCAFGFLSGRGPVVECCFVEWLASMS